MNWYKYANLSVEQAQGIMGLSQSFSLSDLQARHKELMREWHPDINKNPEALIMAQRINAANQVLKSWLGKGGTFGAENIDVPDFMQQEEISMYDFFQEHMDEYARQVVSDEGINNGIIGQSIDYHIQPIALWMPAGYVGILAFYTRNIAFTWNYVKQPKITPDIEHNLYSLVTNLVEAGYSLKHLNWALAQYLSNLNKRKKSTTFWERVKQTFSR